MIWFKVVEISKIWGKSGHIWGKSGLSEFTVLPQLFYNPHIFLIYNIINDFFCPTLLFLIVLSEYFYRMLIAFLFLIQDDVED